MNERIKELLIESIRTVGPDDEDKGAKEKTLEMFAKFIILECLHVMTETAWHAIDNDTYGDADVPTYVHQIEIAKHFGVE